jgi:hypothetical protein
MIFHYRIFNQKLQWQNDVGMEEEEEEEEEDEKMKIDVYSYQPPHK